MSCLRGHRELGVGAHLEGKTKSRPVCGEGVGNSHPLHFVPLCLYLFCMAGRSPQKNSFERKVLSKRREEKLKSLGTMPQASKLFGPSFVTYHPCDFRLVPWPLFLHL